MKSGLWEVLQEFGGRWVLCRCECGVYRHVLRNDLTRGKSTNCGCRATRVRAEAAKRANTTHGMEKSGEYRIWIDMRRRCHSPQRPDYSNYGGRGIVVCEEWRNDFGKFFSDMGKRPDGHTLDRIDNSGNYGPENCRWVPRKQQDRNKRTNRIIEVHGEQMTVADAADRFEVNYYTLYRRIVNLKWTPERAVSTP